jgi:hypothetical protein
MLMKSLRRLIVAVLLGVWCFPAVSVAAPLPAASADVGSRASSGASSARSGASSARPSAQTEGAALGAREEQSQDLQNFKGGGVYIYLGGGVALVLAIILLILII